MKSCTIIISHYESLPFLRACVRQVKKYWHPLIRQQIFILDQSGDETHDKVLKEFDDIYTTSVIRTKPLYSGFGLDYVLRLAQIKTDYICQIHCDAFPISHKWLHLPITLLEEYNLSFVGQLHFYTFPTDTIYPLKNPFFSMSPTFNVARTETYLEMSLEAGFTRFHERAKIDMEFKNKDWQEWAKEDYGNRGSDDDTVAFCWESNYKNTDKLGLGVTGIMGIPPDPGYGRIIDNLVFHFGFCRESKGVEHFMGEKYRQWTERIHNGYDNKLIEEMLSESRKNFQHHSGTSYTQLRNFWNGTDKIHSPASEELNNRIEELKK